MTSASVVNVKKRLSSLRPPPMATKGERKSHYRALFRRMAVILPLFLGLLAFRAVREVTRSENLLSHEEAARSRLIMTRVEPGGRIRFPLEPNTDIIRLVLHAAGSPVLARETHAVRVTIVANGERGSRQEVIDVPAPGSARRGSLEGGGAEIGDPIALNVDVHDIGTGELGLTIDSVTRADAVLVRAYRREAMPVVDALRRWTDLSQRRRSRLARRAGEPDWVDLEPSDRATLVSARWRRVAPLADPDPKMSSAAALLEPEAPPGEAAAVASGPEGNDATHVAYFKATTEHPVVVASSGPPLVLRLSARRPVPGSGMESLALSISVTVTNATGSSILKGALDAMVGPSALDRYSAAEGDETPSDRAVFHVLVPERGTVSLSSAHGAVDVSLSELDPLGPPRPFVVNDEPGDETREWRGFVARWPTNRDVLTASGNTGTLLIAKAGATKHPQSESLPVLHVTRAGGPTLRRDGRLFRTIRDPIVVEISAGPLAVPFRLFSDTKTDVTVKIDAGSPKRRAAFLPKRVTVDRILTVQGESRATLVLGDDLAPGKHTLSFEANPNASVWVHLPWKKSAGRVQTEWVSGDFGS